MSRTRRLRESRPMRWVKQLSKQTPSCLILKSLLFVGSLSAAGCPLLPCLKRLYLFGLVNKRARSIRFGEGRSECLGKSTRVSLSKRTYVEFHITLPSISKTKGPKNDASSQGGHGLSGAHKSMQFHTRTFLCRKLSTNFPM